MLWERRTPSPFIDVRMLAANTALSSIYLAFVTFSFIYYIVFYGLPQYLQIHGGYSDALAGLLLAPVAAITVVLAPLASRLIEKYGPWRVFAGAAVILIGAAAIAMVGAATTSPLGIALVTIAVGTPYSAITIATSAALRDAAPPDRVGVASGLLGSTRYLGAIAATAFIGTQFVTAVGPPQWLALTVTGVAASVVHLGIVLYGARAAKSTVDVRRPAPEQP